MLNQSHTVCQMTQYMGIFTRTNDPGYMYPFGVTGVWKLLSTASVVPFLTQRFTTSTAGHRQCC